jgi:hypothetical protein
MKSMKKNAQIIEGCIILHNILCDIQDDTEIEVPDVLENGSDHELSSSTSLGISKRDQLKIYLNTINK